MIIVQMIQKRKSNQRINVQLMNKTKLVLKNYQIVKNSGPGPRIIIYRGKNKQHVVVGFCMRNDLDATLNKFKGKFT